MRNSIEKTLTRGKRRVISVFRNDENHLLLFFATTCVSIGIDRFPVISVQCPMDKSWLNPDENWTHEKIANALVITYRTNCFSFIVYSVWHMQINCACRLETQAHFNRNKTIVILSHIEKWIWVTINGGHDSLVWLTFTCVKSTQKEQLMKGKKHTHTHCTKKNSREKCRVSFTL